MSFAAATNQEFEDKDLVASCRLQIWKRIDELSVMILPKKLRILMSSIVSAVGIRKRRYRASFAYLCGRDPFQEVFEKGIESFLLLLANHKRVQCIQQPW